ncbi:MAG TPA: hypothetical protein VGG51_14500 [Candidatus Cybelea sp.]|jgi:hypothetical protein
MKRNAYTAIMALVLAAFPFVVRADDAHQNMVMEHGEQVMPFDQAQAMHMFLPSATGGVVEIVVHDMNPTQIALVRSHLLQEAAKFARGDYSAPAYIHGKSMPGLVQLKAGSSRMSVHYFETPSGAAITLGSTDQTLISAIHQWLAAQQSDHNSGKINHCDMQM